MPNVDKSFDFSGHATRAAEAFREIRPRYELWAVEIERIIDSSFSENHDFKIHNIESRAKEVESFRKKCLKRSEADAQSPRYTEPMKQITDLAGVRVILFFPDNVRTVCDFIEQNFAVSEKRDVGADRYSASGSFGYESIHYLVTLTPERAAWPDNARFRGLVCEIQVRTILQHAWAEMEHDIQYKSTEQLPPYVRRKFTALAGMLEIADREFQSIQHEDKKLRGAIQSSIEEDLTKKTISSYSLADGASDQSTPEAQAASSSSASARQLVIDGKYDQAVVAYSKLIEAEPKAHTLYLGRAKVRFLAGDHQGAISDIESARNLNPDDPSIKLILNQIETGAIERPVKNPEDSGNAMRTGNKALTEGDGERAFEYFAQAQDLGHSYVFAAFNKAMACVLAGDIKGARHFMEALRPNVGSPMEINLLALKGIVDASEGLAREEVKSALSAKLALMPEFHFNISPLRNLELGFAAKGDGMNGEVKQIFELLKKYDTAAASAG
jgi:ppGpp synthetase/RelA/SpoT-type nucleotidyltranferase